MKKILVALLIVVVAVVGCVSLVACSGDKEIVVYTNAYFAPFEYYEGTEIVGVDVDIMKLVGEKCKLPVKFTNVEFSTIIPTVAEGKVCDVGSAGITITDARKQQVYFSIPYYTSVQYVIVNDASGITISKNIAGQDVVFWSDLAAKKIGVQTDTTGDIYCGLEINGDGEVGSEDYYAGELNGKGSELSRYDSAQAATDAIGTYVDVVVIDEMPAQYITSKNAGLKCYPLYYDAETATEEEYAMCVPKGKKSYLSVINDVLLELMVADDAGQTGIDKLVAKHFKIEG